MLHFFSGIWELAHLYDVAGSWVGYWGNSAAPPTSVRVHEVQENIMTPSMKWGAGARLCRVVDELVVKIRVFSALCHQLAVRAALDDAALFDHEDLVGTHDRA